MSKKTKTKEVPKAPAASSLIEHFSVTKVTVKVEGRPPRVEYQTSSNISLADAQRLVTELIIYKSRQEGANTVKKEEISNGTGIDKQNKGAG